MKKDSTGSKNYKNLIFGAIIQLITTILFIAFFSLIMLFGEIDYKFSPVFGSVAAAFGALVNAFYLATKKKSKGYLLGLSVGGITFAIVTIIGLIVNSGGVTINTLFHLVIIMLSAITGGILGVNKRGKRYI